MFKRYLSVFLVMMLLLSGMPVHAAAGMGLIINGEAAVFADEQGNILETVLVDGRLYAPAAGIGQYLGLEVTADIPAGTVTIAGKTQVLSFAGTPMYPTMISNVAYVPVLAFAGALENCLLDIRSDGYHISIAGAVEYKQAVAALQAADYDGARAYFTQAGEYADAAQRIAEVWYAEAEAMLAQEQYEAAVNAFRNAGAYRNAAARVNEPYYVQGTKLQAEGRYVEAADAFGKAGSYSDAANRVGEAWYMEAEALLKQERYEEASSAFKKAGGYSDAAARVNEPYYVQGAKLQAEGRYVEAADAFGKAGSYSDAANRVGEAWYMEAEALLKKERYEEASSAFKKAGGYSDAAARVNEPYYVQGAKLQAEGKLIEAASAYSKAGNYKDAAEQVAQVMNRAAGDMMTAGDYKGAYALYAQVNSEQSICHMFYQMAQIKLAAGQREIAQTCYMLAGDYKDAATQYKAIAYEDAAALEKGGKKEEAIAAYKALGDYQDAQEKWKKLTYDLAKQKQTGKKYDEAYKLFDTIRGYSDVDKRLTNASLKNAGKKLENIQIADSVRIGATFTYGNYVHVDSGKKDKQPIVWQVLKKDGMKILVLSQYVLDKKAYHSADNKATTWANCSLRTWLNGSFMNTAFTQAERGAVASTSNLSKNGNGQNVVKSTDKVFLLSEREYSTYLQSDQHSRNVKNNKTTVWTRDRNTYKRNARATCMYSNTTSTHATLKTVYYIRPAMWLNLESTAVDWAKYFPNTAPVEKYAEIKRMMANGKYSEALTRLGGESAGTEVTELTRECRYQLGLQALRTGNLSNASQYFNLLSRFEYKHTNAILEIISSIK